MKIRWLIALFVFVVSLVAGVIGVQLFGDSLKGYTALFGLILCGGTIGGLFLVLVICFFQVNSLREWKPELSFTIPGRAERPVAFIVMALLAAGCLFVVVKAALTGSILTLWGKSHVLLSEQPGTFTLLLLFWTGTGLHFIRIGRRAL
jgi:hypothetical protein